MERISSATSVVTWTRRCCSAVLVVVAWAAVRADGKLPAAAPGGARSRCGRVFREERPAYSGRAVPGVPRASASKRGGCGSTRRAALIAGGSTGPAVVPGNPKESLLVDAINYGETYQMPPKSKLPADEIATLTEWVKRGVPWGADHR